MDFFSAVNTMVIEMENQAYGRTRNTEEPYIQRANYKLYIDFSAAQRVGDPNP